MKRLNEYAEKFPQGSVVYYTKKYRRQARG